MPGRPSKGEQTIYVSGKVACKLIPPRTSAINALVWVGLLALERHARVAGDSCASAAKRMRATKLDAPGRMPGRLAAQETTQGPGFGVPY